MSQVMAAMSVFAVGAPATVKAQLAKIVAAYQPDELIVTGMFHDPARGAAVLCCDRQNFRGTCGAMIGHGQGRNLH